MSGPRLKYIPPFNFTGVPLHMCWELWVPLPPIPGTQRNQCWFDTGPRPQGLKVLRVLLAFVSNLSTRLSFCSPEVPSCFHSLCHSGFWGLNKLGSKTESESEVTLSCPTLGDPMDCSPPGSSVHWTLQARILERVAISFSRGSSWPRDWTQVSCIAGKRFTLWTTRTGNGGGVFFFSFQWRLRLVFRSNCLECARQWETKIS